MLRRFPEIIGSEKILEFMEGLNLMITSVFLGPAQKTGSSILTMVPSPSTESQAMVP